MDETRSSSVEPAAGAGFRLDGLQVDPANGRIAGPGGVEQVDPKVMAVLVALAGRPGELITREALLDAVWADRVVTDDVLSRCIYQLRRHLVAASGSEGSHRLIETLPRRGYRLNGEVLPGLPAADTDAHPESRPWRRVMALAALLAVVVGWWILERGGDGQAPEAHAHVPVSIAVLPFVDLSAEGDQEYFADGVSEELLNHLARIPALRVIARSSSFSFKGQNPDIATVADKLNVTHVLEGSVRRSDDRVRITAQVIDAADSTHLWSETFEREFVDIFAIQDEIALAVAGVLELTFAEEDLLPAAPIPDPQAYALNLQAWFLFNRRAPGDLVRAEDYYRRAIEIDPEYAAAWAGLSGVYFIQAARGDRDFSEGMALARDAAERAVELDPTLPEARARLGRVLLLIGEREAEAAQMTLAAEYGQRSPLVLSMLAGDAYFDGRYSEAIELSRRAAELDPLNIVVRNNLAIHLKVAGRLEEARQELLAVLEIRPETGSEDQSSAPALVRVLVLQGKPEEALEVIARWPEGRNRDRALALVHAVDGQPELFDAAVARLAESVDLAAAVHLAEAFALRGDSDAAFGWLEAAPGLIEPASREVLVLNWASAVQVVKSPFLEPLRTDPRWKGWLLNPRELVRPPDD